MSTWDLAELDASLAAEDARVELERVRRLELLPPHPRTVRDARGGYLSVQAAADGRSRRLFEPRPALAVLPAYVPHRVGEPDPYWSGPAPWWRRWFR